MTEEDIRKILSHGEDYNIEYKQCANEVSHSVYESIASFLNQIADNTSLFEVLSIKLSFSS